MSTPSSPQSKYLPPTKLYDILLNPETSTSDLVVEFESQFKRMSHLSYILSVDDHDDQLYFHVIDYLRMSGLYWALMALYLSGGIKYANEKALIDFVENCYDPVSGGFRGNINHSVHLLYTLSAVQILAIFNRLDLVNVEKLVDYIAGLQRPDGSFVGDVWGEVDTRFSYCAILTLSIVNQCPPINLIRKQAIMTESTLMSNEVNNNINLGENNNNNLKYDNLMKKINFANAINYVISCRNFDGGFGAVSGAESHSGQIFCSLAFLCLVGIIPYSTPVPNDIEALELLEAQKQQNEALNQHQQQNSTQKQQKDPEQAQEAATSTESSSKLSLTSEPQTPPTSSPTSTVAPTLSPSPRPDSQSNVLGWWLCERQLDNGGLNGRPEKKEDVCYSWWVLTGLKMLKKTHWINKAKLTNFILSCQDNLYGGISDRSNTMTDIYHTYFGIAGLSLLGSPGLELVEPVYALPVATVKQLIRDPLQ